MLRIKFDSSIVISQLEWKSIGNKAIVTDPDQIRDMLELPQDWPPGMIAVTLDGSRYTDIELYNKHVIVLNGESLFIVSPEFL